MAETRLTRVTALCTDITTAENRYKLNWINPFFRAYHKAFEDKFKPALKAQEDYNKAVAEARTEFVMALATLGFGATLGGIYSKNTLKAVLADPVKSKLDDALVSRMKKNVTKLVDDAKRGTTGIDQAGLEKLKLMGSARKSLSGNAIPYSAGAAYDYLDQVGVSDFKKAMTKHATASTVSVTSVDAPEVLKSKLEDFVLSLGLGLREAAKTLSTATMSDAEFNTALALLQNAALLKDAPRSKVFDETKVSTDFHLLLHMLSLRTRDYKVTHKVIRGARGTVTMSKKKPIAIPTGHADYVKAKAGHNDFLSEWVYGDRPATEGTWVKKPGEILAKDIDKVYKKLYDETFFTPSGPGSAEDPEWPVIKKAEQTQAKLLKKYADLTIGAAGVLSP